MVCKSLVKNIRITAELRLRLNAYDWVNWSVVIREMLTKKLDELDKMSLAEIFECGCPEGAEHKCVSITCPRKSHG